MTCICGIAAEGKVWLAGDRMASNGFIKYESTRPKVFKNGSFLIGYTTSFRMGQLLEFKWSEPPRISSKTDEEYLFTDVIDSIKKVFKDNDWSSGDQGEDAGGQFLIGFRGKLYEMQPNFSLMGCGVLASVGSGMYHAAATIYNLQKHTDLSTEEIMGEAIETASKFVVSVGSDFDIVEGM